MKNNLSVLLSMFVVSAVSAADTNSSAATPAAPPLSKTVGIHVVKRTVNPDKTITLLYRWNDEKLGHPVERSVILNQDTVIGIKGELKKLSDVTDDALRAPSVATVGPDNTNAVLLRIGRQMIQMSQDNLSPGQVAALEAIAPKPTPNSEASLEERVTGMVSDLKLNDAPREKRLHDVLLTDLKAVRDAHNAGFAPAHSVRSNLNAGLSANLTPAQVETVKDVLTHGMLKHTYDAYQEIVPQLTAEDNKFIIAKLDEAREEALDVKNPDELGHVFEPYKTEIEHYITAHGHDWKTVYKAYVNAQKKTAPAAQKD
jgi:hypothetical protein